MVKAEGVVITNVGILGVGGYRLQPKSSSDTILIMTRGGIPLNGTHVTISGIFKQAVAVSNYTFSASSILLSDNHVVRLAIARHRFRTDRRSTGKGSIAGQMIGGRAGTTGA